MCKWQQRPDPGKAKRIGGERREQPAEAIALAKMLVDDHAIREPEAGTHRDHARTRRRAVVTERDHVLAEERRSRTRTGDVNARRIARTHQLCDRRAPEGRGELELIAAGDEDAARTGQPIEPILIVTVAPTLEVKRLGMRHAVSGKRTFVERADVQLARCGGDHGDASRGRSTQGDKAIEDLVVDELPADGNDPAARGAGVSARGHEEEAT